MDLSSPAEFERVYRRHSAGVFALALRISGSSTLAQDVTQDVFLRLWRRPEAFDPGRGELGSYLRVMARSRALDLWRERQAAGRASDRLRVVVSQDEAETEALPDVAAELEGDRAMVRTALARLPRSQREAVVLAFWGGLTAEEVAHRVDVPLGTAKSRIRLGVEKLRRDCRAALDCRPQPV